MRKKKLRKDIRKSITHSMGRFISIMLLMALGSFALVGLFVTGPNMRRTAQGYLDIYNVADLSVICDYGIDVSERAYIEKASGIKDIEYIYLKDVTVKGTDNSVRIFSVPERVSLFELRDGRYPKKSGEIAIDYGCAEEYAIGDKITFTEKLASEDDSYTLKTHDYTVVGYVYSAEILAKMNRGQTTVGTGELNSYALVCADSFDSPVYMMAKLTYEDTVGVDPYSDEYTQKLTAHKEELSALLSAQQAERFCDIKTMYNDGIAQAEDKVKDAENELNDAREQLSDAERKLADAQREIDENADKLAKAKEQIDSGKRQIAANERLLAKKQKEYDSAAALLAQKQKEYDAAAATIGEKEAELKAAKAQIAAAQKELNDKKTALEGAKKQYEDGIAQLEGTVGQIEALLSSGTLTAEETAAYNAQLAFYNGKLEETRNEYNYFISNTYPASLGQISSAQGEIDAKKAQLSAAEAQLDEGKAQLAAGKQELDSGYGQLAAGKAQLDKAKLALNRAKHKLDLGQKEYDDGVSQLASAREQLAEKQEEYNDKLTEFSEKEPDALRDIKKAKEDIDKAKNKVQELDMPIYSVYTRRELPGSEGYTVYATISEIVVSLAEIFPIFLYFVAALVTLTTMTRFVTEERINSGTLKSLGYKDSDIIAKFIIYGLVAGVTGTVLGVATGHTVLPYIVYSAYKVGVTYPPMEMYFYPGYTVMALVLSLCSSVIPAYIVAKGELREKPASLLLPKAPKAGTKIFLERIKPLWNRMSFTHKVTARNIFRYKSRMFMTIFGVAGATAVLFTGFSVRASVSEINQRQFGEIIKYDMILAENEDADKSDMDSLDEMLKGDEIKSCLPVYFETATITAGDKNDDEPIKVIVPGRAEEFKDYIEPFDKDSGKPLNIENGVVMTEKLSKVLGLKKGDVLRYRDSKDEIRQVTISGICEMYIGHFVFMSKEAYKEVYGREFETNGQLVLLNDSSLENTEKTAAQFMKLSAVKGVVQNTTMYNQVETVVKALNKIMAALIIVAAMLSVVIIYNLTNINVSERIRELSTIKVLGFRDNEVTMYIYRETIILSVIAITVGWGIGLALHWYILEIVPPDQIMFNPAQWIGSFIIPLVIIGAVSFVMKLIVNRKLMYIDMLEALKSVD